MKNKKYYWISIFVFFVVVLIMNINTPFNGDDYRYNYIWKSEPLTEISSFLDVINSNITHYKVTNGRFIPHVLEQSFMGIIGKPIFDIINSIVILLFTFILTRILVSQYSLNKLPAFILSILGFFWAFASMSVTQLWMDGALNYLWPMTGLLLVLIFFLKTELVKRNSQRILIVLLAFFSASCHEGLAIPVVMGVFLYLLLNWKTINNDRILIAFALLCGAICVSIAPGTVNRINSGETALNGSFMQMIVMRVRSFLSVIKYLWVVWISALYWIILLIRDRHKFINQLKSIWGCLWISSIVFVFALGYGAERVAYPLSIVSYIIIIDIFKRNINNKKSIVILTVLSLVSGVYGCFVNIEHMHWHKQLCEAIEKYDDNSDKTVININEHKRESKLIFKDHWEDQIYQRNMFFNTNQICLLNDYQWEVYNSCHNSYRTLSVYENAFIGQMKDGNIFISVPADFEIKNINITYFDSRTQGLLGIMRKIFDGTDEKNIVLNSYYDVINQTGSRYVFFQNPGDITSIKIQSDNQDPYVFSI